MNGDYDNQPTELYDPRRHGPAVGGNWRGPSANPRNNQKTEVLQPKGPRIYAMLVGVDGVPSIVGQVFRLDPTEATLLGRDYGCDIVIDEPAVSRQHAKVKLDDSDRDNPRFFIQDLATDNGIEVNGRAIIKHHLAEGDRVKIGRNTLVFKWVNETPDEGV